MVDLGKHTTEVLLAYGISIALIVILVGWSLAQAKKAKARLAQLENTQK
ncbi:heme exporter protein CcmD [Amylibacter kogurei]|uniref:Heme exporter protein D n=1 Tax=Paramylibacter kogurei TaxID=1889778 RepID=A0A2G5K5T2_9RHOB|nr:heme exporter protein CcmD [Amylibacter kogurei]PIB24382.1 heme exporter protein CcmD [Amylibacter kogurei]